MGGRKNEWGEKDEKERMRGRKNEWEKRMRRKG